MSDRSNRLDRGRPKALPGQRGPARWLLGAAALVVLALAAASSEATAQTTPGSVLRVGTSGDYAPFSNAGDGFDIAVARRLAADLEMRIEWVPFRWPELGRVVREGEFDVAMSGVTWRPERAVIGWMSRAVAAGGPCVLSVRPKPERVAVNRGGILERWAREHFAAAEIRAVDENLALPDLLLHGEVDAIVTDSFEIGSFESVLQASERAGALRRSCSPARDRKVYWVAPSRAAELGPRIDAWIRDHEPVLDDLRTRWLGGSAPRDELDHLLDLIARRLAFMPPVARFKKAHAREIEDPAREARVLRASLLSAARFGVDGLPIEPFFRQQIEIAKAIQRRTQPGPVLLDLQSEIRPVLLRLGDRILLSIAALRHAGSVDPDVLRDRMSGLRAELPQGELDALQQALAAVLQ